jgi:hypothetical protein
MSAICKSSLLSSFSVAVEVIQKAVWTRFTHLIMTDLPRCRLKLRGIRTTSTGSQIKSFKYTSAIDDFEHRHQINDCNLWRQSTRHQTN